MDNSEKEDIKQNNLLINSDIEENFRNFNKIQEKNELDLTNDTNNDNNYLYVESRSISSDFMKGSIIL